MFLDCLDYWYWEDKMTNKYDNVYINDSYSIAGMYESDGPLKSILIDYMMMICILEKKF